MLEPNVKKLVKQQKEWCLKHEVPMLIPHSGICWCCRRNIFWSTDFQESADKKHLTHCPNCNRSFCD